MELEHTEAFRYNSNRRKRMQNRTLSGFADKITTRIDKIKNPLRQEACILEWDFIRRNNLIGPLRKLHRVIRLLQRADIPVFHCSLPVLTSTLIHHLNLHPRLPLAMDLGFSDWINSKVSFLPWTLLIRERDYDRIRTLPLLEIRRPDRDKKNITAFIRYSLREHSKYSIESPDEYRHIPDIVFRTDRAFSLLCRCRDAGFGNNHTNDRINGPLFFPQSGIPGFPITESRQDVLRKNLPLSFRDFHNILLCPEEKLENYPGSFFFDYPDSFLQTCTGLLEESRGLLLFREQIIEIITALAGLNSRAAAELVEEIEKKRDLPELREVFLTGCVENGIDRKTAASVWNRLGMELQSSASRTDSLADHLLLWELLLCFNRNPDTVRELAAQKD